MKAQNALTLGTAIPAGSKAAREVVLLSATLWSHCCQGHIPGSPSPGARWQGLEARPGCSCRLPPLSLALLCSGDSGQRFSVWKTSQMAHHGTGGCLFGSMSGAD